MPKAAIKQPSELDVARAQIAALAEKANTGAAFGMLEHILKTDCKADRQQVEFILTQERNRNPKRQWQPTEKGDGAFRVNKEGETVDADADYFFKRYSSILKAPEQNAGEFALGLAASAIDNLSIQSELVKKYGLDHTAKLMALVGGELGKKLPKPGAEPTKIPGAPDKETNPWGAKAWNITEQGRLVRVLGIDKAKAICAAAGSTWGATKPPKA